MLAPTHILDIIASSDSINDATAARFTSYAFKIANSFHRQRSQADREDAVQSAIATVLDKRPKTKSAVHKLLRNTLKGHFRTSDRRAKKHPNEAYKPGKTTGKVLTSDGFVPEEQHCYRLQLVELLDRCETPIERDFINRVCLLNQDANEAAKELDITVDDMFRFASRIRKS